jgi:uncharacterized protein YbjT (DUF2867 family)
MRALVTGATGFVGRHVVSALDDAGHDVAAMTRNPEAYTGAGAAVGGDIGDAGSLRAALEGRDVAFYLVHSLDRRDFAERDRAGSATSATTCPHTSAAAGRSSASCSTPPPPPPSAPGSWWGMAASAGRSCASWSCGCR